MKKGIARLLVLSTMLGMSLVMFACTTPAEEPSPPAVLSATDVPPAVQPTHTPSPSPLPPTPTPERQPISSENLWDMEALYHYSGLNNNIRAVVFDPESRYLAAITGGNSTGSDHRIHLWSIETGIEIAQSPEFGTDTWDLAFSPRGESLAVALHNGVVAIYSVPELAQIQSFSHAGQVNSLAFSPDGMYLAAGVAEAEGGVVYLWNIDEAVLVRRSWAHPYSIPSLAFSSNGQYLASGAVDRSVKIWQISNGQLIQTLAQAGQGTSVRFLPGDEWLASGMCAQSTTGYQCIDGQVWLWRVSDWTLAAKLTGPVDWVDGIAISPDGELVAGGGRDFGIYIWDRSSGSLTRSIASHQGGVQAVAFSPDGRFFASAATDESVIVWAISP